MSGQGTDRRGLKGYSTERRTLSEQAIREQLAVPACWVVRWHSFDSTLSDQRLIAKVFTIIGACQAASSHQTMDVRHRLTDGHEQGMVLELAIKKRRYEIDRS